MAAIYTLHVGRRLLVVNRVGRVGRKQYLDIQRYYKVAGYHLNWFHLHIL